MLEYVLKNSRVSTRSPPCNHSAAIVTSGWFWQEHSPWLNESWSAAQQFGGQRGPSSSLGLDAGGYVSSGKRKSQVLVPVPGSTPAFHSTTVSRNCINTRKSWGLYSRAPASEYLRSHHAAGSVCFCHPPGWVVAAETPAPTAHRPVVCRVGALGPRLPYKRKHISSAASLRTLLPSAL